MKILITILTIVAFLQTTILPIELVLLILICRAYVKSAKSNLYLAFAFGLLVSHLTLTPLGYRSLTYMIIVQLTQMLSKSRLAGNPWLVMPVSFVLLFLQQFINYLLLQSVISWKIVALEALLSLPVLFIIKLWEERFIVRKEIKLKI